MVSSDILVIKVTDFPLKKIILMTCLLTDRSFLGTDKAIWIKILQTDYCYNCLIMWELTPDNTTLTDFPIKKHVVVIMFF